MALKALPSGITIWFNIPLLFSDGNLNDWNMKNIKLKLKPFYSFRRWFIEPYEKNKKSNMVFSICAIFTSSTPLFWPCMTILVFKLAARIVQYGFYSIITQLEFDEWYCISEGTIYGRGGWNGIQAIWKR